MRLDEVDQAVSRCVVGRYFVVTVQLWLDDFGELFAKLHSGIQRIWWQEKENETMSQSEIMNAQIKI